MGFIHQQDCMMAMRYIRNGTDIADNALVGRTCDNDQTHIRMCLQRPLHFGWCDGSADSKTAFHRWQQKVRRNAAQLQAMVDGFVTVACHNGASALS